MRWNEGWGFNGGGGRRSAEEDGRGIVGDGEWFTGGESDENGAS